jgi:hypothetical protein
MPSFERSQDQELPWHEQRVSKRGSRHDAADLWVKNHVKILLKPNPTL